MHQYDYLIIGGGMTADTAAKGIREIDTTGTIGIVSSEPDAPYSRPPLSKALWKGDAEESVWRGTEGAGVTLHLGRTVTKLDIAARSASDHREDTYGYGKLLLATGGTPRQLPFSAEGVIYYRTFQDYQRVRALATDHERFAVLGGGFIGSEIAAALAMNGKAVVMIVPEAGIGARVFPADLSHFLVDVYREKGVDVRLGTTASAIATVAGEARLTLSTDEPVRVDAVIAGLGIVPNVALARQAGIETGDGIPVDARLMTSREGIFAAGDVANFANPALGERLRVEHEDNALTMGRTAGQSMAGADVRYDHLPFFYSDLFERGYEAVGHLDSRRETFADWKEPHREGVVYYLADGRVRGVLLWNVWGQVDAARAIIAEKGPISPAALKGRLPG